VDNRGVSLPEVIAGNKGKRKVRQKPLSHAAFLNNGNDRQLVRSPHRAYAADERGHVRIGLAHVLSISGYHMAVVAGLMFFVFRALFALMPAFSSRHPIKKCVTAAEMS
jgi:hypothetical protein